ncbi:MAG: amidohydrolase [Lachnospiraceae bacterium]|nr:amidohydrolase [Lachnospiraceae bacterium]
MKIRFYNARILTMKDGEELFEGELIVEDSKIKCIRRKASAKEDGQSGKNEESYDREIDCEGNVLMPGFKNAHTHAGMTAMRSYADDLPLQKWLTEKIFPLEAKMSGEDCYMFTKLAVLEFLTSGITAVWDMYLSPYDIARCATDTGMKIVQVSGINKFGPSLEEMEQRYLKINGVSPLSSFRMGFHAEYTCSLELLEQITELAHKYKQPLWTHNSETRKEVDECIEKYGKTPTELFESLGMFEYGGGGYHCVYLSDNDIEIFKRRGLIVVTNPGSNTKLASGIAPVQKFLDAGIPVAIGTDGPSSNNCLDMFREMFLVTGLAKLSTENASAVDGLEVLKMATVNGAKAMGLSDADILAEGKEADIIMIDLHQPNMQPLLNIEKNIVYSGSKQNVKLTMIHGKILYEDGRFFIGEEPEEIYRKSNEIIKRLTRS